MGIRTAGAPRAFEAIEMHAEGEPGRILTSVADLVEGDTMVERLAYARANLEWLRLLMLHEPLGYAGPGAVLVLPPVNPGSHFGIVVLEQGGFTPMSGSDTICAVTATLETGLVPMPTDGSPTTEVVIDTAVRYRGAVAHLDWPNVSAGHRAGVRGRPRLPARGAGDQHDPGGHRLRRPVLRADGGRRLRSGPGQGP